jgi:hypothetical protein
VIYKLVIDEHFAHHSNSHREILYWEHYPKKGESVVLKGIASEYVPGLEAVRSESRELTIAKSPENVVIEYFMLIREAGFNH